MTPPIEIDEKAKKDLAALDEIEALRAEVAEWKRVTAARSEAEARAERLADALRLAEEHINALTPEWYSAGQRVLAEIRAALGDGDSTVTIRAGTDAFAAAREYLVRDQEEGK